MNIAQYEELKPVFETAAVLAADWYINNQIKDVGNELYGATLLGCQPMTVTN